MSSEDYVKLRILRYSVLFDTVACFRVVCYFRPLFLKFLPHLSHVTISLFSVASCCVLLTWRFLRFLFFVSFDSLNFHLVFVCCHFCPSCFGFVYLFLYPSRFIRNAACRQLFLYLSVLVLLVTNWEPRVLCCDFWLVCALVIGLFGPFRILSVTATHCWSM